MSSAVCVDASVVVRMFVGPDDGEVWQLWDGWLAEGLTIWGPVLLRYEVTNALYRLHRAGLASRDSVAVALDAALGLPIRLDGTGELHLRALRLASELDLPATYDAHYLALARHLEAELWTADARLARRVEGIYSWVRLLPA